MIRFSILMLSVVWCLGVNAQTFGNTHVGNQNTRPEIFEQLNLSPDPRLERLVEMHIMKNESSGGVTGFRLEIFFSSALDARERALRTKASFMERFPGISAHVMYDSPDFKVRVGDFRSRSDALAVMKEVRELFPKAFIVSDIIEFPDLD